MRTRARQLAAASLALAAACSSAPHAPAARSNEAPRAIANETPAVAPATAPDAAVISANPDSPATAAPAATAAPDAGPPELTAQDVLGLSPSVSTSIGSPGAGEVKGAIALPDQGPGFRHNDRRPHEARFGTVELVQGLVKAAAASPAEDIVVINDIGLEHGGPIRQHGSHQSGRDVDVLFFSVDPKGKPVPAVGVPIDPKGRGIDFKDLAVRSDDVELRFDAKRTWRFIASLIEATGDDVQRIFIVEHVRTMLLAEAERVKAPKKIRERFELVTCQPETPHDDHMHVRLFCSAEDIAAGCVDGSPMMPFRRQALKKLGVTPVLETYAMRHEKKRREGVDDRTTSMEEARVKIEKSGPMHARVRRFLDEREAWAVKPAVGRQFCK
jgi:penicillin-insensitive murein endopeptidase